MVITYTYVIDRKFVISLIMIATRWRGNCVVSLLLMHNGTDINITEQDNNNLSQSEAH